MSEDAKSLTTKDAQPPRQAKTGLAGNPGHAKVKQNREPLYRGLTRMGQKL